MGGAATLAAMAFTPLRTERLLLRAMTLADAPALAERRSDPSTAQYQGWTIPYPLERAEHLIENVLSAADLVPGEWFQLAIERLEDGVVVGDLAVHLSENARTAELGYTLDPTDRGRGYATEAARRLVDHLFEDLHVHRIEANTHPENAASIAVLSRLGFGPEGVRRESYWVGETVSDDAIFGLLRSDRLTAPTSG